MNLTYITRNEGFEEDRTLYYRLTWVHILSVQLLAIMIGQ